MCKIKGLNKKISNMVLDFIKEKLQDIEYIKFIELGGNDADISWIKNNVDISGDDMLHLLFELYGNISNDTIYNLKIKNYIITTYKHNDNWSDVYSYKNINYEK